MAIQHVLLQDWTLHVFFTASYFTFFLFPTPSYYILPHFTVHPFLLHTLSMRSLTPDTNTFAHILKKKPKQNPNKQKTQHTHPHTPKFLKNSWGCRLKEKRTISDLGGRQWKPQTGHYFLKQKWHIPSLHAEALSRGDNAISSSVC